MSQDILDHPLIAQRYFFPRRCRLPSPFLVEAGDATLACSFHAAAPGAPTVIHFHGNGEVVADYLGGFPERFTALGWNLLLAEYRGYGMSTGQPLLGRMLRDVRQVVCAVESPPDRVVAFGRSVGSIFAIEAVTRFPSMAGLIIESGVADPLERLLLRLDPGELGVTPEALAAACVSRLDHRRKLASYPGPLLVMHAVHDDLVPVDNAKLLASWACGPVTSRLLPRGDHNSVSRENEDEYFDTVARFLGERGQRPPT
jgi:uncharacterized protein